MRRLNRDYKKGKPHCDSRLFVIVAEGDREDKYFAHFNQLNSRIRVLTIPREQDASAPKHFVGRLQKAEEIGEYDPEATDEIWFVCDTDRWGKQLNELKEDCDQRTNWNLAISNPCFEVWLHYHSGSITFQKVSCNELKERLPQTTLGSFNPKRTTSILKRLLTTQPRQIPDRTVFFLNRCKPTCIDWLKGCLRFWEQLEVSQ